MLPPPNLRPLAGGGGLDPARLQRAESLWRSTFSELAAAPSFPAEEKFFWLAFMLANHYAERGRRDQSVATLEQTLPRLQQVRFSQVVTGMLARNYAATGRVDHAVDLLEQLDSQSEDLQVDTNYRFSTAYVSLFRGDPQTALAVLGYAIDDVPISDAYDRVCGVFRAHAHEALGDLETATQQLQQLAPTPAHIEKISEIARLSPQLPLVPKSLARAKIAVTQMHQDVVVTRSGINVGRIMMFAFLVVPMVIGATFAAESFLPADLQPVVIGVMIAVATIGSIGMTFGSLLAGAQRRKRLLASGTAGVAKLMTVAQTGTRVNHQPMLELRMMVEVPGMTPFAASHRVVVPEIRLPQVQPGAQLPIKVDPKDRRNLAIAWA